jgi:membrane-associated protease RseP (regulator of RpoE activity)
VRIAPADIIGAPEMLALDRGRLVVTNEDGAFTFPGLPAGDYLVNATARDGSAVTRTPVAAGTRDLTITLAGAGAIDGTLVGFASPPRITFVMISGSQPLIEAVVEGTKFHASGLSPGTYVLTAVTDAHEGDMQKVVVRSGPATPVTMTSRGTTTVVGTVRDFVTRGPVAGVRCTPFPRQGDDVGAIFRGPDEGLPTDARGTFRMTASAGEINILCTGAGAQGSRNINATRDVTTSVEIFTVPASTNPGTIDAAFEWARPRISALIRGGAAESAGLLVGDEVVSVDGAPVAELDPGSTMGLIVQRPAGARVPLTILRGEERRSVTVTVRNPN